MMTRFALATVDALAADSGMAAIDGHASALPHPLQESDHRRLAAMGLTVSNPELAQPPTLGLRLPLRHQPQGVLPKDAFRAQALQVGELIQRLGAERPDHLQRASPHGDIVVTERRGVQSSTRSPGESSRLWSWP